MMPSVPSAAPINATVGEDIRQHETVIPSVLPCPDPQWTADGQVPADKAAPLPNGSAGGAPGATPIGATKLDTAVWPRNARKPKRRLCIPGYQVVSVLGRGGMGVVYKARHLRLNRMVALKMMLSGAHASSDQCARFRSEAEAVARLQHSNIVQIYEIGEHE